MTEIMNSITNQFLSSVGSVQSIAAGILAICATIDLVYTIIFDFDQDFMKLIPLKVFKYGVWTWLVSNSGEIATVVKDGFITIGEQVGGGGGLYKDPTGIMNHVMEAAMNSFNKIIEALYATSGVTDTIKMFVSSLVQMILLALCIVCYLFIALNVFLQNILWALFIPLLIPLLGFGVLPKLAFLTQSAISGIVSISSRFAVLVAIMGACNSFLITPLNPPATLNGDFVMWAFEQIAKIGSIALLTFVAPGMAAGFMSGAAPTLNPAGAARSAFNAASGGAAVAATAGAGMAVGGVGGTIAGGMAGYKGSSGAEGNTNMDNIKAAAKGSVKGGFAGASAGLSGGIPGARQAIKDINSGKQSAGSGTSEPFKGPEPTSSTAAKGAVGSPSSLPPKNNENT